MDIKNQICGCNNPQEFTRFCNALLQAEFGVEYQTIDDDRSDGGNDGYIRNEKRLFARHCPKKIAKRSLDSEILKKITSDLKKIPALRLKGIEISKWTFLSNYPISNDVLVKLRGLEKEYDLEISQLGPDYLAGLVLRHQHLIADFPWIEINTMAKDIKDIINLLINKTKEEEKKPDNEAQQELDEAVKLSEVLNQENKSKLKTLFYSSSNLTVQLHCAMSLLNNFDIFEDSTEDLIHCCDIGINAAKNLNKIGEEAVLLAEKGRWISCEFAKLDMETAYKIRMGNTVGFSLVTEQEKQDVLTHLSKMEKEYLSLFKEAVDKAQLSKSKSLLAMVFMDIGSAAGNRFIHFNALGAKQRASEDKKLCKIAFNDAKNLCSSVGDKLGCAYVLHNLANNLRLFDEKEAALNLCEKVIIIAAEYKDQRLLTNSRVLLKRIKSGKIPDYVHGERD